MGAKRKRLAGSATVKGFEGPQLEPEGLNDGFSHCVVVSFAGPEGRDAYMPHPNHLAFCRRWLDTNLEKVCVVDFAATELKKCSAG